MAGRVQVIAPLHLGETAVAALRARGIEARLAEVVDGDDLVALALEQSPTAASAVELAQTCAAAATAGRPICVLVPPPRGSGRAATERAAALAFLRAHGAALGHEVDAWLEAIVTLVRFGMPHGPRTAVIAPAGSWLEAQTLAMVSEAELAGVRPPHLTTDKKAEQTDVVLFDPALGPAPAQLPGLHVPVIARGELGDGEACLYGMRGALGAIEMLGRAAERIAVGVGAAPRVERDELAIDGERFERQLAKLAPARVGDHETKVLLSAYGVAITRQVVAQTPSAAVKGAKRLSAHINVELKPWGHDLPTEPAGCPVERNVTSDALVRRAFNAVLMAAGRTPNNPESAVIVREPPPLGRDVSVSLVRLPALGWTVVLEVPGAQVAAAPAPLRLVDAQALAATLVASRAADAEPDRAGLANLLRRASHLVVDLDARITRLELPRVVVGGRGARTVVADAWCELA